MPVIDQPIHPRTIVKVDSPYGCSNAVEDTGEWSSDRCRYDASLRDPRCRECSYRGRGEAYAESVTGAQK